MTRSDTIGAGLDQLDNMIHELTPAGEATPPEKSEWVEPGTSSSRSLLSFWNLVTAVLVVAISSLTTIVFSPPPEWAICGNSCSTANDGTCDDGGVEGWPFEGAKAAGGGPCALGTDCDDCGARNFSVPKWFFIVCCLVTAALLLVGVGQTARIVKGLARDVLTDVSKFTKIRVPLTDFPFGVTMVNKLANSTQVREKTLKVLQYLLRGAAYSGYLSKEYSKELKKLSKVTSIARRCFKFLRWVKHFEDLKEASEQKGAVMKFLLFFRVAANFGADWAEDVCSLERVGLLPAGTLSVEFMLFAEYCQLALALVEIFVTGVRTQKELQLTVLAHQKAKSGVDTVSEAKLLTQDRKLALVRLELIKFVSDVGKAIYDCELPYAHEGVFIGCSLFSGVLSTHKNMVKALK